MATTLNEALDPQPHSSRPFPRRSTEHHSVSLLHVPRKRIKLNREPSSNRPTSQPNSPGEGESSSSLHSLLGRESSGESSNVESWFDTTNNGVKDNGTAFDNDPPFFLRNPSSADAPQDYRPLGHDMYRHRYGSEPIHSPRAQLRMHMDNSSMDDFRGIIDDLTVENKQLKSRLKKYETKYNPHLDQDRLFEVRIHGLLPEKKHELEDILHKFTAGLTDLTYDAFPPNGYEGLAPTAIKKNRTTDSAYASASASGQGSSSRSDGKQNRPVNTVASRQRNIHSYLHDIPQGLMPARQPAAMSDGMKMRLVVRRLEQIFAGKGAAGDGPQQSVQQQEVSQSAARADRSQLEASGQSARQEGKRESLIMDQEPTPGGDSEAVHSSSEPYAAAFPPRRSDTTQQQHLATSSSTPTMLDQRPTRPLDLDPCRAQVPVDNLRYMRHLGFSPLDPELQPPDSDHGWVFLNLLINMAQLHTVNVTSDFVRQAVGEHSEKLEVSPDGRKLRWKGHSGLTKLRKNSDGSPSSTTSEAPNAFSPRKDTRLAQSGSRSAARFVYGTNKNARFEPSKQGNFPIGNQRSRLDSQKNSLFGTDDDDSAFCQDAGMRSSGTEKRAVENDGPIIFYNNAKFCIDLSGTRGPGPLRDIPAYATLGTEPLGKPRENQDPRHEKRGPLYYAHHTQEPVDVVNTAFPIFDDFPFPSPSPMTSPTSKRKRLPEMEVTGMGGIWPSDNFLVDIRSQYTSALNDGKAGKQIRRSLLPLRVAKALARPRQSITKEPSFRSCILSARQIELQPSRLPPTLEYMAFGGSSPEDEEMDLEGDMTDIDQLTSVQSLSMTPATAWHQVEMPFTESDGQDVSTDEEDDDDDYDDDTDSEASLDLLATARAVDPEAVRQREREYDANMAERLAEEIPAGSSAATAGGGSVFASPANGVGQEQSRRPKVAARNN